MTWWEEVEHRLSERDYRHQTDDRPTRLEAEQDEYWLRRDERSA